MNLNQKIRDMDKYKLALVEVDAIIENMNISEKEKISFKFREFVKQKKDKDYIFNIDTNKKWSEQNIMKETKVILSLIYRSYFCTPEQKALLLQKDREEIEKKENEKREMYNPNNIFQNINVAENKDDKQLKENNLIKCDKVIWYKKLLEKIRRMFKI